ncbi:GNAT family acetyltransferase [Streptococcus pseudoporcinus]|uniref:GNAT family acetyltransferase n=1 Tax=Streptococcus pseudoporcinus TaxID=361101 RepID=A0A4U9ZA70_9STRE|nr:GNAT family N-acetyltransferase [Streptococcus pseudoporcinus]VTS36459.1 GNAT family acetyltransferase [Streptococcus pseudoporcinus]
MDIRLAFPNEVDVIMAIIEDAKEVLAAYGSDQWQDGYPTEDVIIEDIVDGVGYVALEDGKVIAYAAAIYGNEEAYNAIYDGQWLTDNRDYLTFHRIAVTKNIQGQGIAQTFVEGLIEGFDYEDFRCDTHEKNLAMQAILSKLGFQLCGKVPLSGVRLAYQKLKKEDGKAVKYQEIDEDSRYDL